MSYDAFDEYRGLIRDTSRLSDRRQTTNNIMVGINVLFFPVLSVPLIYTHFSNWWTAAAIVLVAIITFPINTTWLAMNDRYRRLVGIRITYLTQLEDQVRAATNNNNFGIYHVEYDQLYKAGMTNDPSFGFSQLERRFILLFVFIYPLMAVLATVLTVLIKLQVIPAF